MATTVDLEEARLHFDDLLRRVKEERTAIVVEHGGEPQAVVIPIEEYVPVRPIDADALGAWLDEVDLIREQIRRELNGQRLPPAEELIEGGRDERDDHLAGLR